MKTSAFDPAYIEIFLRQLRMVTIFVLAAFLILILRLWFLQIIDGHLYRTKSEKNRIQLKDIFPPRGIIYDRNGKALVQNRPSYDLHVIPEDIQDMDMVLESLERLIGLDNVISKEKLAKSKNISPFRPICLKRNLSRDELAIIETRRFNLPGVMIITQPQRHYIGSNSASHLLGYLGEINVNQLRSKKYPRNRRGDLIGKAGVESQWQSLLHGIRGGEQMEADASGRKLRVISRKPPVSGSDVYLTIDRDLQMVAEKALEGKKGAIVALKPDGGEILALASSPTFDPNLFVDGIERKTWREIVTSPNFPLQNRALTGQYPPGSVFKIVVALAGLEESVIDPGEELFCTGSIPMGERSYRCWKKSGHGKVNLQKAIRESCDVYFYKIGQRLGVDRTAKYAKALGLGKTTGMDVGHEKSGLIPTKKWKLKRFGVPWRGGETLSTSIGQSYVLATPIQMANLIATVFNGGVLYKPRATLRVVKSGGQIIHLSVPEATRVINIRKEYFKLVKKALIGVVNEAHGTGWRAKSDYLTIAGKTGTAQVITLEKEERFESEEKVPTRFKDHAWFVAAAPAEGPLIAVSIIIENGGHGGAVAAPIAKEMIESYIKRTFDIKNVYLGPTPRSKEKPKQNLDTRM
ncbi:penicillin-binding protein 2 [Thermodesulfobacteriota bacterium]